MKRWARTIPYHLAIIMDGNGRWAIQRFLEREEGHCFGLKTVREIVQACCELNIKIVTLYAFSKENWKRPLKEVTHIMKLLIQFCTDSIQSIIQNNIKISVIGNWQKLPKVVYYMIRQVLLKTKKNTGLQLNLAINYSGRSEIVDATHRIIKNIQRGLINIESVDENLFKSYLYLSEHPDPELLIRTGGEKRISNFLLWQLSFTEIYVTKTLWPDFNKEELRNILEHYSKEKKKMTKMEMLLQ